MASDCANGARASATMDEREGPCLVVPMVLGVFAAFATSAWLWAIGCSWLIIVLGYILAGKTVMFGLLFAMAFWPTLPPALLASRAPVLPGSLQPAPIRVHAPVSARARGFRRD